MTPENFCYWLNGWFELNKTIDHRDGATKETLEVIQKHLALVMNRPVIMPLGSGTKEREKAIDRIKTIGPLSTTMVC